MDNYLNDAIYEYLKNKNTEGAFYIDGLWGSGKSFFIKEFFYKYNEKNKNAENSVPPCIYISLNGKKTINDINDELFAVCHPKISKIKNSGIGKTFVLIIKGTANYIGIDKDNFELLKDNVISFFKNEHLILILDDFERCRIDLQELFGFITNIIVENNIKVILIGNDIEVKRFLQEEQNYKNRMIAAILTKDTKNFENTVEDIKEQLLYDSIKEKCIYKTYYFKFDENIFFDEIIKNYRKSLQKLVKSNKQTIIKILAEYKCNNLRTCKAALENYILIIKQLYKKFNNDGLIKRQILLASFVYTVLYKNGEPIGNFCDKFCDENVIVYPTKNIEKFIYNSYWNRQDLIDELNGIDNDISIKESKTAPKSIQVLYGDWYGKTDEQLTEEISKLIEDIDSLPYSYYFNALNYFYMYKSWFSNDLVDLDQIMSKMKNNIKSNKEKIDYNVNYLLFESSQELIDRLNELKEEFENHNKTIIDTQLSGTNIVSKEYSDKELTKIESEAYRYHSFFSRLDTNSIYETIENGDVKEIFRIRFFLNNVYGISNINTYFQDDLPSLEEFMSKLEGYKCESVIKNRALQLLKNDVNNYIDKLKEPIK